MADGGTVFGYFVALLVLICGVPIVAICIRFARRKFYDKNDLIEVKLAASAKQFITEGREHIVLDYAETSRNSLSSKAMRQLSNQKLDDNKPVSQLTEAYYQHALQNSNVYWGITDMLFPNGKVGWFQFPPGMAEDFVFYIFNVVNPLAFVFADENHPESIAARFVVFCTAQSFTLMLYVIYPAGIVKTIIEFLLAPIIVAVEYFLTITLLCPCLRQQDDIEDDEAETTGNNQERPKSVVSDDVKRKGGIYLLRSLGALIAFPLIFIMVFMLVVIAIAFANTPSESIILAQFLWDGILFTFLLKMLKASINYWSFLTPLHVNICCLPSLFAVNSWSEVRLWERDVLQMSGLSKEERLDALAQHHQVRVSQADFLHCSCHGLKYAGVKTDTHHTLDVCAPACYCSRCCDAIVGVYWEEGNMFAVEENDDERLMLLRTNSISRGDRGDSPKAAQSERMSPLQPPPPAPPLSSRSAAKGSKRATPAVKDLPRQQQQVLSDDPMETAEVDP
jgi:hypothetical protein